MQEGHIVPNWVFNKLTITSYKENEVKNIQNYVKNDETDFSFETIIPEKSPEDSGVNNVGVVLDWRVENWGCKWDASNVTVSNQQTPHGFILQYNFDTPWSPPLPVVDALARANPDVLFCIEFEEEQGFGAIINFKGNKSEVVKEWDIPFSHAEVVKQGRACYCEESDYQNFNDCFIFRAKALPDITPKVLEAVKGLSQDWIGGFDNLIETCHKL
jgi:hypothetical protein